MRKQTKLVAVLSAAALLAIGASMTSFAKGWTEQDGEWVYLDSDNERVTQEWKKSGSNYYWLDEDGVMATEQIVEDNENIYYVDANGVRVKNQWVAVENEDEVDVNGEEVDTLWYYFGDNGKAYKSEDTELKKKTVAYAGGNGTFFFDSDGHMASGWIEYSNNIYYCGTENEGWAYTGWQYLETDSDLFSGEYDDQVWFNFKSSGAARKAAAGKTTNWYSKGRYYTFNDEGVLVSDWYDVIVASGATAADAMAYTSEDGSKGTGWIYTEDPTESDSYWYYLVTVTENGTVRSVPFNYGGAAKAAKVIKGKTYLFNNEGEMLKGLQTIGEGGTPSSWKGITAKPLAEGKYFFTKTSGSTQGQMITGKFAYDNDGDIENYYFDKTTGRALTAEVKDGVVYGIDGIRIQAEDGNSNARVSVDYDIKYSKAEGGVIKAGTVFIVSSNGKLRTSGTVKVDGVYYDINKDTLASSENTTKNN